MVPDPRQWSVLVTGGASGLGAAVAGRLAALGAAVTVLDRRLAAPPEPAASGAPTPGTPAHGACLDTELVDLADTSAAATAVARVLERAGRLDAVVTCAGIDVPGRLDDVPVGDWERVIAVNLLGTAAVVRAALPALRASRGRVVTIASTLGHRAVSDATAYCASKFGVVGFTRALTAELKGEVGVTLLTPGGMRTKFFDGRDEQYRPGPDTPLADAREVADSVVFALTRPEGCEVKELVVAGPYETSWP